MTATLKACRACREILKDSGYTVTVNTGTEALDTCEICGLRTGVHIIEIRKGEKADGA